MSVQSEIDRIITAVGNAYSKVSEKGGTVPASQTVSNLATAIDSIPAGGGAPSLQSKSVTYTENGTATITPDAGYDGLSSVEVEVNVAGSGGGATEPYIEETYDSNGNLIEAKLYGYTKIRDYLFHNCMNLALTSLPAGITRIGSNTFYGCTNLALTSLPAGITSIGSNTFYSCTNLALTSLPAGIMSIGINAFYGCTNLTSITFEGKPRTINSSAFSDCTNLTVINVPWREGEVKNAPWGATKATINYNYTGG